MNRTKAWIADAMMRLMARSPIEKIRVTDICKEAEISRPTFYYHFKDKYELAAWALFQPTLEMDILSIESSVAALERLRDNYSLYRRAYEVNVQSPYWSYRLEHLVQMFSDRARAVLGVDELAAELAYGIRLYCHGSLGMTREWLMAEDPLPARTVVEMMFDSMPHNLHRAFFGDGPRASGAGA